MKKLEMDLEERFDLSEIAETLRVVIIRLENPDRKGQ